ncbi:MAG: hypothetical protein ACI4XN_13890 [Candidatus Kurthia intestinigallinarum]
MSNNFDPKCHIGETHGVFTLVDILDEKDKYGHYIYKGICNKCGYIKFSHYGNFSGPKSMTTVCNHLDANGQYIIQTRWYNKRIGKIFAGMKRRCYNQNSKEYRWYGAKGIKICNEWIINPKLFEDWAINNGYSDSLTIDRKDETKDYSPDNCRWITGKNNSKYKSTTSLIDVNGEVHTGQDWSKILGFGVNRINIYIRKYGLENVVKFIELYIQNPTLKPSHKQSYYDLYMNTIQN